MCEFIDIDGKEPCQKPASVSVGSNGQWHLCDEHAALPAYKRLKKRRRLSVIRQVGS